MRLRPAILPARRAVLATVLIAAIAGTGLSGCGRKGGLDPPPMAAPAPVDDRGAVMQPSVAPDGIVTAQAPPPAPPSRSTAWIDWLID